MEARNYKIVVNDVCFKTEVPTDLGTREGCQSENKPFPVVCLWNQTGAMTKNLGYSWYRDFTINN